MAEQLGFNIDRFTSNALIKLGVIKTNSYLVRMRKPTGLTTSAPQMTVINNNLEFVCDSTNFPMSGNLTHGVRRYGYGVIEQKPVHPIFSDLFCTFLCDKNAGVQEYFHEWLQICCNYQFGGVSGTNTVGNRPMVMYELGYKWEYAVDIELMIFAPDGTLVRNVKFRDAYPKMMPDIRFAWGELNTMVKIPVIFTFMDWFDVVAEK